jgi:hypothetical protein
MLTKREDFYILDNHKLIVIFVKDCTIDKVSYVLLVAFCEIHQCFCISFRCLSQTFSFWVLSNALKYSLNCSCQLLESFFGLLRRRFKTFPRSDACKLGVSAGQQTQDSCNALLGQLKPSKSMGGLRVYGLAGRLADTGGVGGTASSRGSLAACLSEI